MSRSYHQFKHSPYDFGGIARATAASASAGHGAAPEFVTASGFTIAQWVKVADFSTSVQTIYGSSTGTGTPAFRISQSRQLEIIPRTSGSTLLSAACLNRGEWHHCAVTHDVATSMTTLYCDGEIVAQTAVLIGGVPFSQPGVVFGFYNQNTQLARLSLFGRALTQAEIRDAYYKTAGPSPVARYLQNDGFGSNWVDAMGGSALATGSFGWAHDAPKSPLRMKQDWGSIYLPPGGSYLTLSSSGSDNLGLALAGVGSFQASAWVKLGQTPGNLDIFRINTSGAVGLRFQLDGGTNFVVTARTGVDGAAPSRAMNITVPLTLNRWVHYSAKVTIGDGATGRIQLFRNGLVIADIAADFSGSTSIAWNTLSNGTLGYLGGGTTGANQVPGWIGPVRIDPALTQAQLRSLVFTGDSGAGAPYLHWKFAEGVGAAALNTGSRPGVAATLTGTAAWGVETPW
jgi:hypothetical protein